MQKLNEKKIKLVFFDTETTGVSLEDRIVQVAYSVVPLNNLLDKVELYREEFIKPEVPIKPAAAAVTGIWYNDLRNAKSFAESKSLPELQALIEDENVFFLAHNERFDRRMFAKEGLILPSNRVIDTWRLLKVYTDNDPDCESTSLQYFRYYFDFYSDSVKIKVNSKSKTMTTKEVFNALKKAYGVDEIRPHTALSDTVVLHMLFIVLMSEKFSFNFSEVLNTAFTPHFATKVTFGRVFEKGTPLDVALCGSYEQYGKTKDGISYFNWALQNMDTLSLEDKVGISDMTVRCMSERKLLNFNEAAPMIALAATFLPHHWSYLKDIGKNVELVRQMQLNMIQKAITRNLESGDAECINKGIQLKEDLEFLENYVARAVKA